MDTKLSSYFVKLPSKLPTCIRIFEKKTQLLFVGDEDVKNVLTNIYKNSVLTSKSMEIFYKNFLILNKLLHIYNILRA